MKHAAANNHSAQCVRRSIKDRRAADSGDRLKLAAPEQNLREYSERSAQERIGGRPHIFKL